MRFWKSVRRTGRDADTVTANKELLTSLEPLFRPQSVAIVGASSTPFKQGNVALKYLIAGGFSGAIYPVNPAGGVMEGLQVYPSILDIPGNIDCAFFVIPASATLEAVQQCARKNVRAIIIGSNGFAELGTGEGRKRQDDLAALARAHNIRVLGPNTNGIWNVPARFSLGYNTSHGDPMTAGPVSIVAHSGALFNSIAPVLRGYGACLSKFVPVGNEADTDMLDFLEYFIADDDTRVIGMIVEGISDGARLRQLAQRARVAGKPIVALKLGRSKAGAGAALAHSSRLAGSTRAYEALFRACGLAQVRGIEALAGACALLADGFPCPKAGDFDLVSVATTGGGAELVADHAEEFGIRLAGNPDGSWDGRGADVIATFTGAGLVRNPVDGGNLAGWPRLEELFHAIEEDGRMGPLLFYAHMLPREHSDLAVAEMLVRRRERTGAPLVCVSPGGLRDSVTAFFANHRVPVFRDMASCFEALRSYYDVVQFRETDAEKPELPAGAKSQLRAVLDGYQGAALLDEIASSNLLRMAGIPLVESIVVDSIAAARTAFEAMNGSVVLKGIAPGIAHKNDAGLVMPGLSSQQMLESAFVRMDGALEALPSLRSNASMIMQKMLPSRVELIAGVTCEEPLGYFLVVGLGGIYAEALDEVRLISVPASRAEIEHALDATRIGALLRRLDDGGGFSALRAVCDVLLALQTLVLAAGDRIRSVDINPLLIGKDHCTGVDALVELQ